jgi:hypothetical protein
LPFFFLQLPDISASAQHRINKYGL